MKIASVCSFLSVLLMLTHAASAQVIMPERNHQAGIDENVFGLGAFGGAATGIGLSFRHHLPSKLSYQIVGGIIKIDNRLSFDIGGEVQYDFLGTASGRFYFAGGAGYYYSGKDGNNAMKAPTRIGLGVGGEFAVTPGVHTELDLLFTFFNDGTILPLPQLGFHYYFY